MFALNCAINAGSMSVGGMFWFRLFKICLLFFSCGNAHEGGKTIDILSEDGYTQLFYDQSGQLVVQINFDRDSLKEGCFELFSEAGSLLLQANFSNDLHDGVYSSFSNDGRLSEMGNFSKGLKDGFQQRRNFDGSTITEYYSKGIRHGGKMLIDSGGRAKAFSVYFADRLLGEINGLNDLPYSTSGKLHFLDVLPDPNDPDELLTVIRVAGLPGFRAEVSVALQDDSTGAYLRLVDPLVYSQNLISWALRDIYKLSPEVLFIDLKLVDPRGDFAYRELVAIPPGN